MFSNGCRCIVINKVSSQFKFILSMAYFLSEGSIYNHYWACGKAGHLWLLKDEYLLYSRGWVYEVHARVGSPRLGQRSGPICGVTCRVMGGVEGRGPWHLPWLAWGLQAGGSWVSVPWCHSDRSFHWLFCCLLDFHIRVLLYRISHISSSEVYWELC